MFRLFVVVVIFCSKSGEVGRCGASRRTAATLGRCRLSDLDRMSKSRLGLILLEHREQIVPYGSMYLLVPAELYKSSLLLLSLVVTVDHAA